MIWRDVLRDTIAFTATWDESGRDLELADWARDHAPVDAELLAWLDSVIAATVRMYARSYADPLDALRATAGPWMIRVGLMQRIEDARAKWSVQRQGAP